jgi:transcriptional regulatory protein LevR/transcriptional regulator with AAA-type ATPase domain
MKDWVLLLMNRIDKVLEKVRDLSFRVKKDDVLSGKDVGFSATDIADLIGSQRNNVTNDLNNLYKQGILIKVTGKPTLFFDRQVFERLFNIKFGNSPLCCINLRNLTGGKMDKEKDDTDVFKKVIGYKGSLTYVVKQAKSAILYPPSGLHTLILGETGVGKSMFAEVIYEYGKAESIFSENAQFVAFNCADYANNPQLLVSQLFGYIKGAYTGAEKDKPGLMENADGGVLFLDEIHRLPPEGQEMLFTFIDKGTFRRLGESKNDRSARVLIIAATTENPDSNLLGTFIRRIPMVLELPPLRDRKLSERFSIIQNLYKVEAKRLNQSVTVDKDALLALLTYSPVGNIGQLKSDIQLSVARAFLEYRIKHLDVVSISRDFLPDYVKDGLLHMDKDKRCNIDKLLNKDEYCFTIEGTGDIITEEPKYDFIKYFYSNLKYNSDNRDDIQRAFEDFTEVISSNLYLNNNRFPDFFDDTTEDMINILSNTIHDELGIVLDRSIYYSLAIHLNNITKYNLPNLNYIEPSKIESIKVQYPDVYRTAINIIKSLETNFDICCPYDELYYLSVILSSLKDNKQRKHVGVLVITHGNEMASNLAFIANELLSTDHVKAINMPLTEKPDVVLDKAIELVRKIDEGRGVILLVDMGSLTMFAKIIREKTGIDVRVVDNISTIMVIETARKTLLPGSDIKDIVYSLISLNQTLCERSRRRVKEEYSNKKNRVIFTVCASGQGTAFYLEKSINDILKENNIFDIQIIPLSLANKKHFREFINDISKDKYIIAVVGSIDPVCENIPFISLQEVLLNNGLVRLIKLIDPVIEVDNKEKYISEANKEIVLKATAEVTEKYLQFLSADKIMPYINECIHGLESSLDVEITEGIIAKIYIHAACMIERIIFTNNPLTADENMEAYIEQNKELWNAVKQAIVGIEHAFNISISDDEVYFIVEILKDNSIG